MQNRRLKTITKFQEYTCIAFLVSYVEVLPEENGISIRLNIKIIPWKIFGREREVRWEIPKWQEDLLDNLIGFSHH